MTDRVTVESYWAKPPETVVDNLRTSRNGLTETEAAARLEEYGYNRFRDQQRAGRLELLGGQFESPIILLLAIASVLSFALGERVDAFIILTILLVSGLLGFWQEYRATNAVERLLSLVAVDAEVCRDGTFRSVSRDELVPGDIVRLNAGDTVPADCRLLSTKTFHVDEAALTGESFPVDKTPGTVIEDVAQSERASAVFMGTHIISGEATAVVVRPGKKRSWEKFQGVSDVPLRRQNSSVELTDSVGSSSK